MKRFLAVFGTMWILMWLAFTGFFAVALDPEIYFYAQQRAGVTAENADFSDENRLLLDRETALYLAGRGEPSGALSARAERHMRDVKALFDAARYTMYGALAAGLICLALSGRRGMRALRTLYWAEAAMIAVAAAGMIFLSPGNFGELFQKFHMAAFSNDFWLLDPAEDALIRVMPQAFFENMATFTLISIGLRWLLGGALISAAHWLTGRKIQA